MCSSNNLEVPHLAAAVPIPAAPPPEAWSKVLAPYRAPKTGRSVLEIIITAAPLFAIWVIAWALHGAGLWWAARFWASLSWH